MLPFAEIVETKALLDTVLYSLAAGIGVTTSFSVAIYGAARAAELRRNDRPALASASIALAALGLGVSVLAVVLGVIVMTTK